MKYLRDAETVIYLLLLAVLAWIVYELYSCFISGQSSAACWTRLRTGLDNVANCITSPSTCTFGSSSTSSVPGTCSGGTVSDVGTVCANISGTE